MKNPKISVIIPIFNAEQCLSSCIESIFKQTFSDFELLLINDGSSDRSGKICEAYARKDDRIRVFNKTNGGVSSARNLGIDEASGQFCVFVDADDFVSVDYLANLAKFDFDFCVSGITEVFHERKQIFTSPVCVSAIGKLKIGEVIPFLEEKSLLNGPCQKLFKVRLIRENNLKFKDNCSYGEDTLFVLEYLLYIDSLYLTNTSDYCYVLHHHNSLTKVRYPFDTELAWTLEMLAARIRLLNKFLPSNEKYKMYIMRIFGMFFFRAIHRMYNSAHRSQQIKRVKNLKFAYSLSEAKLFLNFSCVYTVKMFVDIFLLKLGRVYISDAVYLLLFRIRKIALLFHESTPKL